MSKVNISLPEGVLHRLDKAARESRSSRSAFLAQAVQHYLDEKEEERKQEQRRRATQAILKLAEEIGPWDGTAEVIKWRDRH